MKKRWLWIVISILILVVAAIAISKKSGGKVDTVQVTNPEKRTIIETVVASGKIFPVTEVKISSDVSGAVVELYVAEGDSVVRGQLLAKIDPDIYVSNVERGEATLNSSKSQKAQAEAQVLNAKAQKEQIEAQLINAKAIFDRSKQLRSQGVISVQDFEAAEASYKGLEANLRAAVASVKAAEINVDAALFAVKSAEASLKELRTSLQRTSIFAPVSGIVSRLDVEKGERVVGTIQMTGTEMMRISNLNDMEVQVEVSENDIIRVSIGDPVDIEVDAFANKKFKGIVYQIANSVSSPAGAAIPLSSEQVSNFVVRIRIDPASYAELVQKGIKYPFRPGMSASVSIATEQVEQVIAVPIQSVTTREWKDQSTESEGKEMTSSDKSKKEEKKEVVFIVENDIIKMVQVTTGLQDDSYIEIKSGLDVNQTIVTGPYSAISRTLNEGNKVKTEVAKSNK